MRFGLKESDFQLVQDLVVAPLKKKGAQIFVFGSRARGQHHQFSDLDLFYIEAPATPVSGLELSNIRELLEESNLPVKVDLVNWCDLAESYKNSADRDKVEL